MKNKIRHQKENEVATMLTWQKKNGEWGLNGVPEEELKKVGSRIYAALFKLKDYEQLGVSPGQVEELDRQYTQVCERLAKQKIPCMPGDTIYIYETCECIPRTRDQQTGIVECPFESDCPYDTCRDANERLFQTKVMGIYNTGHGWYIEAEHIIQAIPASYIGNTVFFNPKEAYNRLHAGAKEDYRKHFERRFMRKR